MPEDQGVNGARWTEQAAILLTKLGWQKIADSNIDIEGTEGRMHGIDSLYKYVDGYTNNEEGVFLESKRYLTASYDNGKFQDWVSALNNKISSLKNSHELETKYPEFFNTKPRTGILMIWFHDVENYPQIRANLQKAFQDVKVPQARGVIRLFVLSNDQITRLASLVTAIDAWISSKQNHSQPSARLNFFYPSSMGFGASTQEIPVLNVEFMFSRFVLSKFVETTQSEDEVSYLIFYFGQVDLNSLVLLKDALLWLNVITGTKYEMHLYLYHLDESEFRKIQPDVERIFKETFLKANIFRIRSMDNYTRLPSWMGL